MGEESPLLNGGHNGNKYLDNVSHGDYGSPFLSPDNDGDSQTHSTPLPASPLATIDTSSVRHRRTSLAAMRAAEVILHDREIRRESQYMQRKSTDDGGLPNKTAIPKPLIEIPSMESLQADEAVQQRMNSFRRKNKKSVSFKSAKTKGETSNLIKMIHNIMSQLPAIAIASVLNFMVGIPFGASYFPTELPLPGKEVLGLRMFLFATALAQLVFTFKSKFVNGIGLQMVENVPFCLELARIVIDEQGNGSGAASTLFFLFGLSSVIVGVVFYLLGVFKLGKVVYFFPSHVLVGCIGGIGLFIGVTSLEVTTNTTFTFTAEGIDKCIVQNINLLVPVIAFEVVLRLLMHLTEKNGEVRYPLLGPIYYCFITPVFYAILWAVGISVESAQEAGYFFPPLSSSGSIFSSELFDIFTEVHPTSISWKAVVKSLPTMVSLTAFSLIHVPINIPAFAVSTGVEPDMNAELIAHGYSNALSGLFGGLQNYMAYSNSVIYSTSNGKGKWSSLAIVAMTILIFIYGPTIASYVPRCMAGTLLLHVGIDLFLEGVVESYPDYDRLEYSGILLITIFMVTMGMDAALIAGLIAALSTYAAQSIVYQDPIRGSLSGARLRSSAWNRCHDAQKILLDNKTGRQRIYVIQMQGHIFFGNVTKLSDDVKSCLNKKREDGDEPAVVILDFTHVLGLDSSAAQSVAKLKCFIVKNFDVEVVIFVTGHEDGFRCTYDLSHKVIDDSSHPGGRSSIKIVEYGPSVNEHRMSLSLTARALHCEGLGLGANHVESKSSLIAEIPNSRVCETLDDALIFAEDVLIALQDPSVLRTDSNERFPIIRSTSENINVVKSYLETLFHGASANDIDIIYTLLSPEKYLSGDIVWQQGAASESLKLVVEGSLISLLDDEHGATESIFPGSTIGELGLLNGVHRLTTVKVISDEAILYSLSKEKWEFLTQQHPRIARYIDLLVIRYLSHRVQHVSSSNILDRRSLPV